MTKPKKPKHIDFDHARALLARPGYSLQEIKTNRGSEFVITPGGPVTEITARRLLSDRHCRELDPGLLPGVSQSWIFRQEKPAQNPKRIRSPLTTNIGDPSNDKAV
jgi:hypothetical protein